MVAQIKYIYGTSFTQKQLMELVSAIPLSAILRSEPLHSNNAFRA